jgi:hypothetical protein
MGKRFASLRAFDNRLPNLIRRARFRQRNKRLNVDCQIRIFYEFAVDLVAKWAAIVFEGKLNRCQTCRPLTRCSPATGVNSEPLNTRVKGKETMGRPEHKPDKRTQEIVSALALNGVAQGRIAEHVGISEPSLRKH